MKALLDTIARLRKKLKAAKKELEAMRGVASVNRDLVPSGLHMLVGEMRSPIYKPFARFNATQAMEVDRYSIVEGSRILETKPFSSHIVMCAGDSLVVHLETDHVGRA